MMNTEKHPLDFDALKLGEVISRERIAQAFPNKDPDHRNYGIDVLLPLKEQIEQRMEDRLPYTVRVVQYERGLRILESAEIPSYEANQRALAIGRYARSVRKQSGVDVTGFGQKQLDTHWAALTRDSMRVQFLNHPDPAAFTFPPKRIDGDSKA